MKADNDYLRALILTWAKGSNKSTYSHSANPLTKKTMKKITTEEIQQMEFDFMKDVEKRPDESGVDPTLDKSNPKKKDLFKVGTVATILQLLKLPDGTVKVLVEGEARVFVRQFFFGDDHLRTL